MPGQTIQGRNINFHDVDGSIQPIGAWSDVGLEGCFFLTGSLPRAVRNRAHFKPDASLSATAPVVGSNYLTFTGGTSWLQTLVPESSEHTLIAVAKWQSSANYAAMVSSHKGTSPAHPSVTSNGAILYAGPASTYGGSVAQYWDGVSSDVQFSATLNSTGFNIFNMHVARIGASGLKMNNMTVSTVTGVTSVTGTRDPSPANFRIGSSTADYIGSVDMAFAAVFSRQLADSELTPFYIQIQAYLASQGVTI
jgi:hypothetical protein